MNSENNKISNDCLNNENDIIKQIRKTSPFNILDNYDKQEVKLDLLSRFLYTPCLTNKLFVATNLYGHELIRYYDF